jgi:hypothetical protein
MKKGKLENSFEKIDEFLKNFLNEDSFAVDQHDSW